jgi:hypothetical protein
MQAGLSNDYRCPACYRPDAFSLRQREVSELLCLGPVYFSSFGSDFAKAR